MDNQKRPIYITGSPRSGSTVMLRAIREATGFPAYNEGLFLNILRNIDTAIEAHFGRWGGKSGYMLSQVNKDVLKKEISEVFKGTVEKIFEGHNIWIDKTVNIGGVVALSYIRMMWPKAKIIFMKRRPIETLISRFKKFPEFDFYSQCESLAAIMNFWYEYKKNLPDGSYLEIDQKDISLNSKEVAKGLANYLELDVKQENILADIFTNTRPEYSGGDEKKELKLKDTDWSEKEKGIFLEFFQTVSEKYGYTL